MSDEFTRRDAIAILTVTGLGGLASTPATARRGQRDDEHEDEPTLNRLATTVRGAEITGMYLTQPGRFFFNIQHPSDANDKPYNKGTVGALVGTNLNTLPQDFASVQVPDNKEEAETVHTAVGQYQALANGGDKTDNDKKLGIPYSADGEPMTDGNNPDYNGFIPADQPNEGYLFTNWETRPGMVSRLHIRMQGRQGRGPNQWNVLGSENVNFRDVEGTWNNCFGTVTPWNTPLTSEEYEPNAAQWYTTGNSARERMSDYLGRTANPYRYGYIIEIEDPTGTPTPVKQLAMGRFSHENAVVMPDQRTVYLSDDGTGTVFFKFVADTPGDLSAGTLYAAKATQDAGNKVATTGFDLQWIKLAHGTHDQVESWIAEYDDQEPGSNTDYITDAEVKQWARGKAKDDRVAFLEARKAAAAKGATNEFRKMEGVNIKRNAKPGDYLYMAMSNTNKTMLSNQDASSENDDPKDEIQLEGNEWGAVYRMQLGVDYNVSRMEPVVTGGPNANICGGCPYDAQPNSASTVCQDCEHNPTQEDENGIVGKGMTSMKQAFSSQESYDPENTISEPDNIVVMDDGRVIIGEDTGNEGHDPPNMIWVYNPN
ncbi:alkaline phosphatase PhoX [Haladaptatus sp. DFWS20]|uniref:alkaline phosphatase PhoX n=1 Tax=Haladaptatus sp. DFWS20 TaxID=3403467 RepID=UPI003EB9C633